jgi:D-alanine-D-alanine ligase
MSDNLAIIFGGPSPEHDISILTGLQTSRVLSSKNQVLNIYWSQDNKWYLVDENLESKDFIENTTILKKELNVRLDSNPGFYYKKKKLDISLIINSCHGGPGEDGTLQSLLELLEIQYSGPSISTSQLCMDKYAFFTLMSKNKIPVLNTHLISDNNKPDFQGPYILKPRFGGSSIGVELVENFQTALTITKNSTLYKQGAILQPYLQYSDDLLVGVRTYPKINYSDVEKPIRSSNNEMFSYKDKYLENGGLEGSRRELPAKIDVLLKNQIIEILNNLLSILEIKGICRVDFLSKGNEVYLNEVNTIPGSYALYLWENVGFSKFDLLNDMVNETKLKTNNWTNEGSDGTALKTAKDIQSKLG